MLVRAKRRLLLQSDLPWGKPSRDKPRCTPLAIDGMTALARTSNELPAKARIP